MKENTTILNKTPITQKTVVEMRQRLAEFVQKEAGLREELSSGKTRLGHIDTRLTQLGAYLRREEKPEPSLVEERRQLQEENNQLLKRFEEIPGEIAQLPLTRTLFTWEVIEAELQLASQGGSDLMQHPGYTSAPTDNFFPMPLTVEEITSATQEELEGRKKSFDEYGTFFEEATASLEKEIVDLQAKNSLIKDLQKQQASTREQRKLAIASGKNTTKFDEVLESIKNTLQTEQKSLEQSEDIIAGLNLRLAALQQAQEQACNALETVEICLGMVEVCQLAADYNEQAKKTADIYREFNSAVNNFDSRGLSSPIRNQFPRPIFGGKECVIPQIKLHWNNPNMRTRLGFSSDGVYFFGG